jgi:hypothetical protein
MNPPPIQTVNFTGDDDSYTTDQTTYDISMSPPGGGLWQVGNYVSYVIATLDANRKVVSDPSDPTNIDITPPGVNPPKPTVTSPTANEYIDNDSATSVTITWTVEDIDYPGFYTFTVMVSDDTTSSTTAINDTGLSSSSLSHTVSLYPGQFNVTVTSVSSEDSGTSSSTSVPFFIKLPSPTGVTAT